MENIQIEMTLTPRTKAWLSAQFGTNWSANNNQGAQTVSLEGSTQEAIRRKLSQAEFLYTEVSQTPASVPV